MRICLLLNLLLRQEIYNNRFYSMKPIKQSYVQLDQEELYIGDVAIRKVELMEMKKKRKKKTMKMMRTRLEKFLIF